MRISTGRTVDSCKHPQNISRTQRDAFGIFQEFAHTPRSVREVRTHAYKACHGFAQRLRLVSRARTYIYGAYRRFVRRLRAHARIYRTYHGFVQTPTEHLTDSTRRLRDISGIRTHACGASRGFLCAKTRSKTFFTKAICQKIGFGVKNLRKILTSKTYFMTGNQLKSSPCSDEFWPSKRGFSLVIPYNCLCH